MKPFEFTISKNAIILTLLTLLSSVIIFTQIRYRRLETQLKLTEQPIYYMNSDTIATATLVRNVNTDSILEANKLLKKKVDYYFEYYRKGTETDTVIIFKPMIYHFPHKNGDIWVENDDTLIYWNKKIPVKELRNL